MTWTEARVWLVQTSLALYLACAAFFALAPALRYPLSYADSFNNLKIVVPVLLGHLGAAVHFAFGRAGNQESVSEPKIGPLAMTLVKWPPVAFAILMTVVLIGFGLSNQGNYSGSGMTPNILSLFVSLLAGLLSGTTGLLSSYLFSTKGRR